MVIIIFPTVYVLLIFILVTYKSSLKIQLVIVFVKSEWFGWITNSFFKMLTCFTHFNICVIIKDLIITRFREFTLKYNWTENGYMQTIQTYTPLVGFWFFFFLLPKEFYLHLLCFSAIFLYIVYNVKIMSTRTKSKEQVDIFLLT